MVLVEFAIQINGKYLMKISKNFDSGNIRVIETKQFDNIQLEIEADNNADFFQWFHFRLQGAKNEHCKIRFINASQSAFPEGWQDYQALASYDRKQWFRVPTHYDGKELVITHTPEFDSVHYAYFAPYSDERHQNLLSSMQCLPNCQLQHLGETLDGRDLDALLVGTPSEGKRVYWIIARQHPGESMSQWFIEGLLNTLLDNSNALSKKLLEKAYFYIVPNVNPDGACRGNLRTNSSGRNLNREWLKANLDYSPEVYLIKQKMQQTGVDFFLDVHGDETLPCNFLVTCEGIPSYDERHNKLEALFKQYLLNSTPEYQVERGYDTDLPGQADLSWGSQYVGETYRCLSFVLEMPFKDNDLLPDGIYGWSPKRSIKLAEAMLYPMYKIVDKLR